MTDARFSILNGDWNTLKPKCESCHIEVFVNEQQIPMEIEFDSKDATSWHFVVVDNQLNGTVMGNARLLPDGHIGRVCVLQSHRKFGVGSMLMQAVMQYSKQVAGHSEAVLESQVQAQAFYAKLGFQVNPAKGIFPVSNIPHVEMRKQLVLLL